MAKILYYDCETTGVRYWKDGIHQISGIIEVDGEIKEHFDFKVKPNPSAEISEDALKVANVTIDQIMSYPDMRTVYSKLTSLLGKYVDKFNRSDKFHLCGYNNRGFDDQFLREWFSQNGDKYFGSWFWADTIDIMVLASNYFIDQRSSLIDFKLKTVCAKVGITIDESKLHDAVYDISLTKELFKVITKTQNNHE
jgi:DNA polymerase-3 subunit epsilon